MARLINLFSNVRSLTPPFCTIISFSGIAGTTTNEWEYGTYEFDEQNMSSSNSTTEENNEYIPGTFEGTLKIRRFRISCLLHPHTDLCFY